MKSLTSIIKKLSSVEIEAFRMFLKNGKNRSTKKLKLLDTFVSTRNSDEASASTTVSRQSVYQLKKRLQDDLYSFLMLQDQLGDPHDQFFLEMDCHRKLYCFKILFDKGVHDHAGQILQEVIDTTSRHNIHSLYLEAVNLRNTCFPLRATKIRRSIPISYQLRKLRKSLGRNLYVNQYRSVYDRALYETDVAFRSQLIEGFVEFDLTESENVIERLSMVNHLFFQREFRAALNTLEELMSSNVDSPEDRQIDALIRMEAAKACVCLDELTKAREYLQQAEDHSGKLDSLDTLLLELRCIIQVRQGELDEAAQVATVLLRTGTISGNQIAVARGTLYLLSGLLAGRNYREVIKYINANITSLYKQKFYQANLRLMELLSIFQLSDLDWLSYKIENFRKSFGNVVDERLNRIIFVVALLRTQLTGKNISSSELDQRIKTTNSQYPWHPLGLELLDFILYARPFAGGARFSSRASIEVQRIDIEDINCRF